MADQVNSLEDLGQVATGAEAPAAAVETAVTREPVRDALGRAYATGKRKDAVATCGSSQVQARLSSTAKP